MSIYIYIYIFIIIYISFIRLENQGYKDAYQISQSRSPPPPPPFFFPQSDLRAGHPHDDLHELSRALASGARTGLDRHSRKCRAPDQPADGKPVRPQAPPGGVSLRGRRLLGRHHHAAHAGWKSYCPFIVCWCF